MSESLQPFVIGALGALCAEIAARVIIAVWRGNAGRVLRSIRRFVWPLTYPLPTVKLVAKPKITIHLPRDGNWDWDKSGHSLDVKLRIKNGAKGAVKLNRSSVSARLWNHLDSRDFVHMSGDPFYFEIGDIGPGSSNPIAMPINIPARSRMELPLTLRSGLDHGPMAFLMDDQIDGAIDCQLHFFFEVSPRPGKIVDAVDLHGTRDIRVQIDRKHIRREMGTWDSVKSAMISAAEVKWPRRSR